jgi:hypothetical protein
MLPQILITEALFLKGSNSTAGFKMAMTDQERDYYRKLLEQDYAQAPLTDSQKGDIDGTRAYNNAVPAVNQVTKSGEPLRRMHPADVQAQIDKESDDLSNQLLQNTNIDGLKMESPEKTFPLDKFNDVDPGKTFPMNKINDADPARNPSSTGAQGIIDDVLLGKQDATQIPMLPSPSAPSTGVGAANVPLLTDITRQSKSVSVPKPGSTASQTIPQQQIADNLNSTHDTIDSNLRGTEQFFDSAKEGEEAKFNSEEAKSVSQAQILDEERKKIQAQLDENQQRENAARKLADDQMQQIGQVDPGRVWQNTSLWAKLSLVAGAAASGSIGSPAGLEMMKDMVSKDIESQKADMEAGVKRQGSLLELLKPYATNKIELLKMANGLGTKIAENYSEAIKSNVGKGAATSIALEKTMKGYLQPLLTAKNINDSNTIKGSSS